MRMTRFSHCIFALLGCSLIFLLAACGGTSANPTPASSPTTAVTPGETTTPVPAVTTQAVPPGEPRCPPEGPVAGEAVLPVVEGPDAGDVAPAGGEVGVRECANRLQ